MQVQARRQVKIWDVDFHNKEEARTRGADRAAGIQPIRAAISSSGYVMISARVG